MYLGVAAFAVHGHWRLVTTWNQPTRPPIDWWQRGPFEAVVVPGLAIAIGVGIVTHTYAFRGVQIASMTVT